MELKFLGSESMTVDVKNRVGIPAKYVAVLRAMFPENPMQIGYYVTPEGALKILPAALFEEEVALWEQLDDNDEDQRVAHDYLTSTATLVELDSQNRFKLEANVKKICGIDREVVFAGNGKWMKVYDQVAYEEFMDKKRGQASSGLLSLKRNGNAGSNGISGH